MPRKQPKQARATKGDEIKIRVAPEDKELFETAARNRGLSMSAWIRMVALDAARGPARQP
jgi:uncharacterized protein (DUF1778 family)